jgi:vWA-MoxR associated protein C-terminal domain
MAWFGRLADADGDVARLALVTVVAGDGRTAGGGVYLSGRTVLTCAHVVNDALGRGPFRTEHPGPVTVEVGFPGLDTGFDPGLDTGFGAGSEGGLEGEPVRGPVSPGASGGPGAVPHTVLGRGHGAGPDTGANADPDAGPGHGPGAGRDADPDVGPQRGPSAGPDTDAVLHAVRTARARLAVWVPARTAAGGPVAPGDVEWTGDLALLELDGDPPPGLRPLTWREMSTGQDVRAWYGGGQRFSYARARVYACDGRVGYLDGRLSGAAIGPGYSGGPLWSEGDGAAVGLVAGQAVPSPGPLEARQVVRRSWAIPWQRVRAELERAGAPRPAVPGPVPVDDAVRHRLLGPLTTLLGDPALRADRARALAAHCGRHAPGDGSPPTLEELAAALAELPRATATLTESLVPAAAPGAARTALDRLLALGRLADPTHLLSHREHARLLTLLHRVAGQDPALLPRAVRGALPYVDLPGPLRPAQLPAGDVAGAVAALEGFAGDSTPVPDGTARVPALLRVVEYLAAAVEGGPAEELRQWSGDVAARLGIHPSALAERRADAAAWARPAAAHRSRVIVELARRRSDPEDQFRCAVWRTRRDGSAARVPVDEDRPHTAQEVARLVREAVEGGESPSSGPPTAGGPADELPAVEFVVDRAGLQWPVDEWDSAGPGALIPERLGEDWHVALRCPQVRRRSRTGEDDLRRRWAERNRCAPLVVDGRFSHLREVIAELKTGRRDCGHVVLHGPDETRAALLEVCLAMGVPVVLWDRAAAGHDGAARLDAVGPTGALDGLPERVRFFRAKAYAAPEAHPARPALVWEDAGQPLPGGLWLADPEAPAPAATPPAPGPGEGPPRPEPGPTRPLPHPHPGPDRSLAALGGPAPDRSLAALGGPAPDRRTAPDERTAVDGRTAPDRRTALDERTAQESRN